MRTILIQTQQGLSATVQVDAGTLIRIGRGGGRPGDINVEHQRDGSVNVQIAVDTLSTRHAELRVLSSSVVIKDVGSTNGTLLPIPAGENHICRGLIQLGPEVTLEIDGENIWRLPQDVPCQTPDELVAYLRAQLRDVDCRIELAKDMRDPHNAYRIVLPLLHGRGPLFVTWGQGTIDLAVQNWVRAAVNGFNIRNQASAATWKFTATSPERQRTLDLARRAAPFEDPVLVLGPSGCGKGVLAEDIHDHSLRAGGPFVHVNCTAVPTEIFEREFFGHTRGAFTGATAAAPGFLHAANGGTLFLDEIGDMPLAVQGKLLTFLDNGEFTPLGAVKSQFASVRILAATNKDLTNMLGSRFREDLYYRLAPITIPVSAPQAADIHAAAFSLARHVAVRNRVTLQREEIDQIAELAAKRTYPGHFRELQSALTRYLLMREPGKTTEQTWRDALMMSHERNAADTQEIEISLPHGNRGSFVRSMENYARLQLARRASSVTELARQMDQTTAAVYAWFKRAGLKPEDIGDSEAIRQAIEAEVEGLQPYGSLLHDLWLKKG